MTKIKKLIKYEKDDDFYRLILSPLPNCIFRGLGSSTYELIPTAYRETEDFSGYQKLEDILSGYQKFNSFWDFEKRSLDIESLERATLRIFYELANKQGLPVPDLGSTITSPLKESIDLKPEEKNGRWITRKWEAVGCLAQHYGAPTRFLDWTSDINVALYFASMNGLKNMNKNSSGCITIWVLNTEISRELDIKLKFIRPDYSQNPNMCAQSGLMTLIENATEDDLRTPLDEYLKGLDVVTSEERVDFLFENAGPLLKKIDISYDHISKIVTYLMTHGFNGSRFNPGYTGVWKAMDDYSQIKDLMP